MKARVLLYILNEVGESDKNARRVEHFIIFLFATRLISLLYRDTNARSRMALCNVCE